MADNRTVTYATTREITDLWRPGIVQSAITLAADSGSVQANKDRIFVALANTQAFQPGDYVRVYDSSKPSGEVIQMQAIVESGATSYLETVSDMIGNYTTANTAKVVLLSAFTSIATGSITGGTITTATKPSSQEVNRLINEIEDYIDAYTRMSWKSKTITAETHDYPIRRYTPRDWLDGNPVKLNYRELKTVAASDGSRILDTASGDKLEVWNGSTFEDYLVTRSAGRKASHYVDAQKGLVYFRTFYKIYGRVAVRVTYRIGISTPSNDVKRACALLVAAQLYSTEDYTVSIPGGGDLNVIPVADKATRYREEAHVILNRYREMVSIW